MLHGWGSGRPNCDGPERQKGDLDYGEDACDRKVLLISSA